MRAKHSETIQKLKAQFLQEKKQFQDQSDTRIQAMAKQANQVSAQNTPVALTSSGFVRSELLFYTD